MRYVNIVKAIYEFQNGMIVCCIYFVYLKNTLILDVPSQSRVPLEMPRSTLSRYNIDSNLHAFYDLTKAHKKNRMVF